MNNCESIIKDILNIPNRIEIYRDISYNNVPYCIFFFNNDRILVHGLYNSSFSLNFLISELKSNSIKYNWTHPNFIDYEGTIQKYNQIKDSGQKCIKEVSLNEIKKAI